MRCLYNVPERFYPPQCGISHVEGLSAETLLHEQKRGSPPLGIYLSSSLVLLLSNLMRASLRPSVPPFFSLPQPFFLKHCNHSILPPSPQKDFFLLPLFLFLFYLRNRTLSDTGEVGCNPEQTAVVVPRPVQDVNKGEGERENPTLCSTLGRG